MWHYFEMGTPSYQGAIPEVQVVISRGSSQIFEYSFSVEITQKLCNHVIIF